MKGIDMSEIKRRALAGVELVGKGALLCLGLLAMAALVVVMGVLMVVMLIATALPATSVRLKHDLMGRRDRKTTSELSAPRNPVPS
jgi:hypothetical protein